MSLTRRLSALLVAAVSVLGLVACSSATGSGTDSGPAVEVTPGVQSKFRGLEYSAPPLRPSFVLTDTTGAAYDFSKQTAGKPTLLYFGYTNCPDICPTIMAAIATALDESDPALVAEIQVVFVTTDPDRDTGPVLAEYLSRFDKALKVEFVGLTGTLAEVEKAQTATGVPVAEDEGKTHSTLVNYYGRANRAQVAFLAGASADDIIHDLPIGAS